MLFQEMMTQTKKAAPVPYLDLPAQMKVIRQEIDAAIARTLDNCSFCLGPDVAQFEKEFAKFCGAEHCVAFNSGTSALHIAMLLLNVGRDDEVITTPSTFVATSWAVSYLGAKPVFVDRSEERRVGKGVDLGGRRIIKKKKEKLMRRIGPIGT